MKKVVKEGKMVMREAKSFEAVKARYRDDALRTTMSSQGASCKQAAQIELSSVGMSSKRMVS